METRSIKSVVIYYGANQNKANTCHDCVKFDGEGVTICYSKNVKDKSVLKGDIMFRSTAIANMLLVDNTLLIWLNTWQVNYMNK